ncbi:MAG: 3D domain-containing protein [Clostridiales bacterium]|nr:3D domain-containing protein [Clostridiales bacterium]
MGVDPEVIPYGTTVIIDGHEYIAEDTGSALEGNTIDIFFDTHEEALEYGRQTAEVFIKSDAAY